MYSHPWKLFSMLSLENFYISLSQHIHIFNYKLTENISAMFKFKFITESDLKDYTGRLEGRHYL